MAIIPRIKPCCCAACGNCTKAPTYDGRTPCCCAACGHCFKPPVYRHYPLHPVYPVWPTYRPPYYWCSNTTNDTSVLPKLIGEVINHVEN